MEYWRSECQLCKWTANEWSRESMVKMERMHYGGIGHQSYRRYDYKGRSQSVNIED